MYGAPMMPMAPVSPMMPMAPMAPVMPVAPVMMAPQPMYAPPPPMYAPPPPMYSPPPPPPQQQTIIITGNNNNNDSGNTTSCPTCGKGTGSIPRKKVGMVAIMWCLLLSSCGLCYIPLCCTDSCKDIELVCVKCQTVKSKVDANCC